MGHDRFKALEERAGSGLTSNTEALQVFGFGVRDVMGFSCWVCVRSSLAEDVNFYKPSKPNKAQQVRVGSKATWPLYRGFRTC